MRWIHLIARTMPARRLTISRAFAKAGFVVTSIAIVACGQGNLASPRGRNCAIPRRRKARPATLHVIPLHGFTIAEAFIGRSGGSAGLIGDPGTALYGVAPIGGDLKCRNGHRGCGFVYELTPQVGGKSYKETPLYTFLGKDAADGAATQCCVSHGRKQRRRSLRHNRSGRRCTRWGQFIKLVPTQSGAYKETVLYSFGATPEQ